MSGWTGGASPSAWAISSSARILARVERRRWRAAAASGLDDKPVADSTDRLDPSRLLELAAHLVHRLLEAVLEAGISGAPNAVQQLRSSHHLARPVDQDLEHQQRPPLQLQRPIAQPGDPVRGVNAKPAAHHRTDP